MSKPNISDEEKRARKRAYMKKYWQDHKDERNAAVKRWKEAHPEQARERSRKYIKKWLEENRDKWNQYQREYYQKRKEEDEAKK